ncbi:MAG: hypothetical protein R3E96_08930 [Planctomycetota bacterium]
MFNDWGLPSAPLPSTTEYAQRRDLRSTEITGMADYMRMAYWLAKP